MCPCFTSLGERARKYSETHSSVVGAAIPVCPTHQAKLQPDA
jgi:hypothetical protein